MSDAESQIPPAIREKDPWEELKDLLRRIEKKLDQLISDRLREYP